MTDRTQQLTESLVRASAIVGEAVRAGKAIVESEEIETSPWEVATEILGVLHDDLSQEPGDPAEEVARRWGRNT